MRGWSDPVWQTILPPVEPFPYRFGTTVRGIDDFNGDGYGDLAIGDPSGGNPAVGAVHICLGGPTGFGPTVSRSFPAPAAGNFATSLVR